MIVQLKIILLLLPLHAVAIGGYGRGDIVDYYVYCVTTITQQLQTQQLQKSEDA